MERFLHASREGFFFYRWDRPGSVLLSGFGFSVLYRRALPRTSLPRRLTPFGRGRDPGNLVPALLGSPVQMKKGLRFLPPSWRTDPSKSRYGIAPARWVLKATAINVVSGSPVCYRDCYATLKGAEKKRSVLVVSATHSYPSILRGFDGYGLYRRVADLRYRVDYAPLKFTLTR